MEKKYEKSYIFKILGIPMVSFGCRKDWKKSEARQEDAFTAVLPADTGVDDTGKEPVFVVNSLTLHESFRLLTETENENLFAITGSVMKNIRSLERIVPLDLSTESAGGAEADDTSVADAFLRLNSYGLRPLAYFHSHPGYGANATRPSVVDRRTQSLMEQSTNDIIGGIVSRDGYMRFFANDFEPNVKVVGKQVRRVDKNVYKLEIEEDLSQ